MPSQRRIKVFGMLAAIFLLTMIYITSSSSNTRTSDFYSRTVAALDAKTRAAQEHLDLENHKAIQAAAEADAAQKASNRDPDLPAAPPAAGKPKEQKPFAVDVEEAKGKAKDVAAGVADAAKDAVHGVAAGAEAAADKSVAGRKMMKGMKDDGVAKVGNSGAKDPASGKKEGEEDEEDDKDHEIEVELNSILKKSPIIIFSKSYCPYSKKAKHILLDKYNIVPAPYVEELDHHPLGPQLQAALQKTTGRRTVPNVLINGKSIGGGDDIGHLDSEDKLISTIKDLGGKRIMEVTKVESKQAEH